MRSGGKAPKDRRRSPRQPCELWANWIRRSGNIEATVADLSERGLFLRTSELPQPGELVRLEVFPSGGTAPIEIVAVVRFTRRLGRHAGFGVELHAVDNTTQIRWKDLYSVLRAGGSTRQGNDGSR